MNARQNLRGIEPDRALFPARCVNLACLILSLLMLASPSRAEGLEGRFEVRSADLELQESVYHLNARLQLPIGDTVRRGLAEGVPLSCRLNSTSSACVSCCRIPGWPGSRSDITCNTTQ